MIRTDIAKEMRRYVGRGTIKAGEVAAFIGDKNVSRVRKKYLTGLEAIGGTAYLITEVADRLKEACEVTE